VNKIVLVVVGLVVLIAAGPTIIAVMHALVPLVAVAGVIGLLARAVWFYTR
jgi:hypothetical protein